MAYNILYPVQAKIGGDMSANVTSDVVEIRQQDNVGVQLNWTGSPVGTFYFQVSMDYMKDIYNNVVNPGNWVTLTVTPGIAASGTPDSAYVDLNQLSAPYLRVIYVASSGTGSVDILISAKGV